MKVLGSSWLIAPPVSAFGEPPKISNVVANPSVIPLPKFLKPVPAKEPTELPMLPAFLIKV